VAALLDDPALFEDHDQVGSADGGQPLWPTIATVVPGAAAMVMLSRIGTGLGPG
jgi:hypothetical protein